MSLNLGILAHLFLALVSAAPACNHVRRHAPLSGSDPQHRPLRVNERMQCFSQGAAFVMTVSLSLVLWDDPVSSGRVTAQPFPSHGLRPLWLSESRRALACYFAFEHGTLCIPFAVHHFEWDSNSRVYLSAGRAHGPPRRGGFSEGGSLPSQASGCHSARGPVGSSSDYRGASRTYPRSGAVVQWAHSPFV